MISKTPAIKSTNTLTAAIKARGLAYISSDRLTEDEPIDTRFLSRIAFLVCLDIFPITLLKIVNSSVSTGRKSATEISVLLLTVAMDVTFG